MGEKVSKYGLTDLLVVSHALFDRSKIYDLETYLIEFLFAETGRELLNTNRQREKNYERKEEIRENLFLPLWKLLYKKGIVASETAKAIEQGLLFRFSPYKMLSKEQEETVEQICSSLTDEKETKILVGGDPETGKSLLISNCVYELVKHRNIMEGDILVVMPQKHYPIVFVDEAHRLKEYFRKRKLFLKHLDENRIEDNELELLKNRRTT